jgi:hypothetical protein
MRASDLVVAACLLAGCSKQADKPPEPKPAPAVAPQVAAKGPNSFEECTRYVDKARPVIEEMTKKVGQAFGPAEIATFVRECSTSLAPREPLMDCVLAAADEPAVRRCYDAAK